MLESQFKQKDVYALTKCFFNIDLTPNQVIIVRIIAFSEHRRVCINAMTRYGKSLCVAIGVALYILTHSNKKIAIIAPQNEQASIIRNYIADLISICSILAEKVDIGKDNTIERLKKETSRKRWTFTNGNELRTISAHGEANRLMGFGADLIICDESALISREAYARIVRMLGDDPENSVLIELANPWDTDNKYYDHYISGRFKTIHIDYKIGLKEGRITQSFLDEVRYELTPLDFTVLYESNFPEQSEDSIFSSSWYEECIKNRFSLWDELLNLRKRKVELEKIIEPLIQSIKRLEIDKREEAKKELKEVNELLKEYKIRIACDPADKGLDWTVIFWGVIHGSKYQLLNYHSEAISDNMAIASKILDIHREIGSTEWFIDGHGLGVGVVSRCKQLNNELKLKIKVKSCLFGGSAINKDVFRNQKAENYFHLRRIMKEGRIQLIDIPQLRSDLLNMKWKKVSEKTVIEDPEKSPDYADSCIYFVWKDKKRLSWF